MAKSEQKSFHATYEVFGRRLDAVMNLVELSNSRLAKECNVDPSHISRFRNGLRTPRSNQNLCDSLSAACWRQLQEQNKLPQLAELMEYDLSLLSLKIFQNWLCNFTSADQQAARMLIKDIIEYYPRELTIQKPEKEQINALIHSAKSEYPGYAGLQEAALAFLASVLAAEGKEILIYADLSMDWLFEDREFLNRWSAMMAVLVEQKVRIRIVHNIDRNPTEMNAALRSWMPIYMSGIIEPFYSTRPLGRRFAHVLFVCPGVASVDGFISCDQENDGLYRFCTEPSSVRQIQNTFNGLLKGAKRLLKLTHGKHVSTSDEKEILHGVFANIRIYRQTDVVIVERLSEPNLCFWLYHPLMLRAFDEFAER